MPELFKSKFHDIKLVITGTNEPNNGRELWVADIYMNGINYYLIGLMQIVVANPGHFYPSPITGKLTHK